MGIDDLSDACWLTRLAAAAPYVDTTNAIVSLHFHHLDRATKAFEMTMASGRSLAAYREEARKCVLVCANCHGEIEAGLVELPGAKLAATAPID